MGRVNCHSKCANCATKIDKKLWEGYTEAYVIGGGPSLENFNWKLLGPDKFIVGVNTAYQVIPNAQVVYFTDDDWYELHKKKGFLDHKGVKIKGSLNVNKLKDDKKIYQFCLIGEKGLSFDPGILFHGRNSPYAVCNMLVQWGFKKIYLLGIDMQHGRNMESLGRIEKKIKRGKEVFVRKRKQKKKTHWHDGHRRIDNEGAYSGFMKNWEHLAKLVKKHDVEIINVNNASKLVCFPKQTYEQHFGNKAFIRKEE